LHFQTHAAIARAVEPLLKFTARPFIARKPPPRPTYFKTRVRGSDTDNEHG
jgi:hypothetical protein